MSKRCVVDPQTQSRQLRTGDDCEKDLLELKFLEEHLLALFNDLVVVLDLILGAEVDVAEAQDLCGLLATRGVDILDPEFEVLHSEVLQVLGESTLVPETLVRRSADFAVEADALEIVRSGQHGESQGKRVNPARNVTLCPTTDDDLA